MGVDDFCSIGFQRTPKIISSKFWEYCYNSKAMLLILISVILLSGCVTNPESQVPSENQKFCNIDDDCATAPVGCDGCSCGEPINKIHREKYMEDHQKACKNYDGSVCKNLCKPYELKCVDNTCVKEFIEVEEKTCEDKEGSKDYYTKGGVTTCIFGNCAIHEDFCPTDFDDPTGKELYEYYCDGNEFKFEEYTCPNGCEEGACIR